MGAKAVRPGRILAGTLVWLLALGAMAWWALASWAEDGAGERSAGAAEVDTAVTVAQAGGPGLRLHLMTPLHLVPGHRAPVRLALTNDEGRPLAPDTRLVVYAAVRAPDGGPSPVVVDGPAARPMSAGELAVTPLRLLPAGDPACGELVAELRVRVALVDDGPTEIEQVRGLAGPDCDGPDVVPAPDTVNLDRPVRADEAGWYDELDQLMREPVREPRQPRRRADQPEPTEPEPEPEATEPEPEPTEPEPEPTEPEPGPTEPEPGPTEPEPSEPDPKPSPQPTEPKPSPPAPPEDDA